MTAAGEGQRHCAACDRMLTDFSKMSDDELLIFFKHRNGKLCGRFSKAQLDRTLTLLPEEKRTQHWWKAAALIPLAFFASKASAQNNTSQSTVTPSLLSDKSSTTTTQTTPVPDSAQYRISGVVRDEASKEPVIGAIVQLFAGANTSPISNVMTDVDGRFSITVPDDQRQLSLRLLFQGIGYHATDIHFSTGLSTTATEVQVNMETEEVMLEGEIVVVDEPTGANFRKPFWSKIRGVFAIK